MTVGVPEPGPTSVPQLVIVLGGRVTVHGTELPLLSVQPPGGGVGQLDGGPVMVSVQGAG